VPGDPEQPAAGGSTGRVEPVPLAEGPLEGERRDVFGGDPVPQKTRDVGVEVVPAVPIQILEGLRGRLDGGWDRVRCNCRAGGGGWFRDRFKGKQHAPTTVE